MIWWEVENVHSNPLWMIQVQEPRREWSKICICSKCHIMDNFSHRGAAYLTKDEVRWGLTIYTHGTMFFLLRQISQSRVIYQCIQHMLHLINISVFKGKFLLSSNGYFKAFSWRNKSYCSVSIPWYIVSMLNGKCCQTLSHQLFKRVLIYANVLSHHSHETKGEKTPIIQQQ